MPEQHESKKCLACGGEALYIQDVDLVDKRVLGVQWCQAALYRCASCGHIELYQRPEDREWQERLERQYQEYQALPDYRCPLCGRVGKNQTCPHCAMLCTPVGPKREDEPPPPGQPEKKKKRGLFGGKDKPDWER